MKSILHVLTSSIWLLCSVSLAQGQNEFNETGIFLDTLKIPGNELRIAITINRADSDDYEASFNSLDQGSGEIKFDEVIISGSHLILRSKAGIEIEGDYNTNYSKIEGEFRQGPARFKMEFVRIVELPVGFRPQEPQPPYPYREEEVKYINEMAGVQLAGTLTLPEGEGPFPAVVLLTGSGPQDRNETIWGHKPFLVIADFFTRRGIAVLRSDDRGVGASGGVFEEATTEDFADDALAAVAYLKTRHEILPEKIGMIGHSEGGMMAPVAATKSDDVAFIILMAGPGVNLGDNVAYQGQYIAKKAGASEGYLNVQKKYQLALNEIVRSNISNDEIRIKALEEYQHFNESERQLLSLNEGQIKAAADAISTEWWRYALLYNPEETLNAVKCPVLALLGENDRQVPVELNLEPLKTALGKGHPNNKVEVLPGLNHLFQSSETGDINEYARIEETISPAALEMMLEWMNRNIY